MPFFRRSKDAPKIEDKIGYHGLADWPYTNIAVTSRKVAAPILEPHALASAK